MSLDYLLGLYEELAVDLIAGQDEHIASSLKEMLPPGSIQLNTLGANKEYNSYDVKGTIKRFVVPNSDTKIEYIKRIIGCTKAIIYMYSGAEDIHKTYKYELSALDALLACL